MQASMFLIVAGRLFAPPWSLSVHDVEDGEAMQVAAKKIGYNLGWIFVGIKYEKLNSAQDQPQTYLGDILLYACTSARPTLVSQ